MKHEVIDILDVMDRQDTRRNGGKPHNQAFLAAKSPIENLTLDLAG
jgi:hypothetical protein